jgi:hypothetical protein
VSAKEIASVVESKRCSVNDPDVRTVIIGFRAAYEEAGLDPLSPFPLMDMPPAAGPQASAGPSGERGPPGGPAAGGAPAGGPPSGGPPPSPHAPDEMFPIAGMPAYTGGPEQACPTLSRLLDVMDRKLRDAGQKPAIEGERRAALLSGSCSLEDPSLASMLGLYRDAFGRQGIRPLPPFEFFGDPPHPDGNNPSSKRRKPPPPGHKDGAQ